jgi:hypothetical protein
MAATAAPTVTPTVKPGDTVAVSYYGPKHEVINTVGFVSSVDFLSEDLQGPNGEPAITVIVVDRNNLSGLSGAQFSKGLIRLVNVVVKGQASLAKRTVVAAYEWEDIQSHLPNLLETIEAPPDNPIFERPQLIAAPDTATVHAAAVQTGQIEGPTVVPPSLSEVTGTTGAPPAPTEPQQ